MIIVEMPLVTNNAGSTLTSYQLYKDDGFQSDLQIAYTGLNRTVEIKPTVTGRTYRFMYRVANMLGWSEFSQVMSILSAEAPSKPTTKPELISLDLSQITIRLGMCENSNGDLIS
jgi:hypothetical protein